METANLISQLVGNKTVAQESLNKPKFLDLNPASRSLHQIFLAINLSKDLLNKINDNASDNLQVLQDW